MLTELEADDPDLAAAVRSAFSRGKHCTIATLRADGAPRISGTEVEFSEDAVFVGSPTDARKAVDMRRDPRVAIHSPTVDPVGDQWPGEAKLSGLATEVSPGRFRIDLTSAVFTGLTDEDPPRLRIRLWRPGRATETMFRS
ncbi:MAG: pyridoxamine 5'-phosphate oxidase family protein [Candidatus Nanopelagicales bacterium]|jgi:hypothetical protein|nr:pyridoxamine 5'-phosphate oxidase family protein [Candidatus Nanopelagicales bacterium]MCU0296039.1 pyridoxamine 5'-phosphate oxidase family protein [Candidatus Nanopelagicales bacterium]